MTERKFLTTEDELLKLLPLIRLFSEKTNMPCSLHIQEVCQALTTKTTLVLYSYNEVRPLGYLCGYFINSTDFYISQALSLDGEPSHIGYEMFEEKVRELGAKKLLFLTHIPPEVFAKYGFKLERYLLTKEVE
jgi:hypothetical protein